MRTRSISRTSARANDRQRRRQHSARGPGWKGEQAARRKGHDPVRDGVRLRALPHAVLQTIGHRQRQTDPVAIQGAAAVAVPREAPLARGPEVDVLSPTQRNHRNVVSLEFFNVLNFVLQFCPTHPTESRPHGPLRRVRHRRASDVRRGYARPDVRKAIFDGMADAWRAYRLLDKQMATGEITSADVFGTRIVPQEHLSVSDARRRRRHLRQLDARKRSIRGISSTRAAQSSMDRRVATR